MGSHPPIDLARLLIKPPYRFDMGLRREDGTFFRNRQLDPHLLEERSRWLAESPERYTGVREGAGPLLSEARQLFSNSHQLNLPWSTDPESEAGCRQLAERWEPDFLLLRRDPAGVFRLVAGGVCFPSSWALEEKLGQPLLAIHGPVPGLNHDLGSRIDTFLGSIKPGVEWERMNWGLAAVPDRNLHPALQRPRLNSGATLASTWLRIEHQAFRLLPSSGGLLFGIRLEMVKLEDMVGQPDSLAVLAQLLESMAPDIAEYKGLAEARPSLIRQLQDRSGRR